MKSKWLKTRRKPNSETNQKPLSNSQDLWLECAQLGLTNRPNVNTALQQLSVNPKDKECLEYILGELKKLKSNEILNPEPFRQTNPDILSSISGPIALGKIRNTNVPWGLHQDSLTEHLVCVGRTGGGKTTVIKRILQSILQRRNKC